MKSQYFTNVMCTAESRTAKAVYGYKPQCGLENQLLFSIKTTAQRILSDMELAAAENSFARVLNPHGGAYILSFTDRLFRSIRTLLCGYQ